MKNQLLPDQIISINDKLTTLKKKLNNLINDSKEIQVRGVLGSGVSDIPDSKTYTDIDYLKSEIKKLEEILENSEVVSHYNEARIGIGTRFAATLDFNGELETEEYILVDTKEGTTLTKNKKVTDATYITVNSPFGKAIVDKKIGDSIVYQVNDMTVVGLVEDIVPENKKEKTKVK